MLLLHFRDSDCSGLDVKATLQHYAFVFIVFNTFQYLFVMSDYVIRIDCQTKKEEEKIYVID